MGMEMEKLSLTVVHPIVGTTANMEGLIDIERTYIEDKTSWSAKSVEGLRIVKKYKDPNCNLVVTVLRGSDMDYALSRALLYPKTKGSATWLDERVDNQYKGGTGILEAIIQTSDKASDENAVYTLMMSKYTGS